MIDGFYHAISKYYDYIFPVGQEQLAFLKNTCNSTTSKILDVACGNGGYSVALAQEGHLVTAVDLDETMVAQAKHKAQEILSSHEILFRGANMLDLSQAVSGPFDLIFCIGNSIVHLGGLSEVKKFLLETKKLLAKDGSAVFQIINFDRVFAHHITALPTIKNEKIGLTFERNYSFDEESGKVLFGTVLSVDGLKIDNSIPLYPLISDDFAVLLAESGFKDCEFYGDFEGARYDKNNSYMLVIRAR